MVFTFSALVMAPTTRAMLLAEEAKKAASDELVRSNSVLAASQTQETTPLEALEVVNAAHGDAGSAE